MTSHPTIDPAALARAADWIGKGQVCVLTGAGISVDSGIPDFRSPGGLWERFPVMEYATLAAFEADPAKVWRMFRALGQTLVPASFNAGHEALARLEAAGLISALITQNVDGLHQAAGSQRVIEFHGSATRLACITCRKTYSRSVLDAALSPGATDLPRCACGQVLKPDVVLFGEPIPTAALWAAREASRSCQTCLICGTSALVSPAADIPQNAAVAGARLIEVNLEPTHLSRQAGTLFLQGSTSEVLPALAKLVLV